MDKEVPAGNKNVLAIKKTSEITFVSVSGDVWNDQDSCLCIGNHDLQASCGIPKKSCESYQDCKRMSTKKTSKIDTFYWRLINCYRRLKQYISE